MLVRSQARPETAPSRARRIVVACRGSVAEGLGHLYRSATFAAEAEARHKVAVIARMEPDFAAIFDDIAAPLRIVVDDGEFAHAIAAARPDVVVLDMVDLADQAFAQVRAAAPVLASISPVFRHAAATDLFFTRGDRPAELAGPEIFAGLEYTIVNRRCKPIPEERFQAALAEHVLPMMLSFGGADADNHSRLVLEVLREVERPLLLWIMLGDGYLHSHDELVNAVRASSRRHEVILARTNRSMWGVVSNCALAVLSSGLSTIEAIYAGMPVISMHRLNDPARQVKTAYEKLCVFGGSFADGSYQMLRPLVEELYDDRPRLSAMRSNQRSLVDGRGAGRVLQAIERAVEARR